MCDALTATPRAKLYTCLVFLQDVKPITLRDNAARGHGLAHRSAEWPRTVLLWPTFFSVSSNVDWRG
jgi:hypothetical protein